MQKQNLEMVVFDMAGTTIDEQNVVYKTLKKAINYHDIDVDLTTVLRLGAGKEKHHAIKDILEYLNIRDKSSEHVFLDFKSMLDEAYENLDVIPIKGVVDIMVGLRAENIRVVLNTGYDSKVANKLLHKLEWSEGIHFDALITADDVEKGRPYPDMIYKAMELFNIDDVLNVLKAGDSAIDIKEGKNAKCGITVGVLSGAQTKEQLEEENPTIILESLADLDTVFD